MAGTAAIWVAIAIVFGILTAVLGEGTAEVFFGCLLLLPLLIAGLVYSKHLWRIHNTIERGLRYASCPRCRYSLCNLPFIDGRAACPECGLVCDKHALGMDTSAIDRAARAERIGPVRAVWTDFITRKLACLEGLTREQRSGVLRAAGVARGQWVIGELVLCVGAVIAGASVMTLLPWLCYLVLPPSVKADVLEAMPIVVMPTSLVGAIAALPVLERSRMRRCITRHPRLTICVKCRRSLANQEITDNCVVCPGCTYISSLYELGLVRQAPKDTPSPPASECE